MALYLAIAHTGKTLQLGVQPSQRVDAVQQALVAFTGVPVADQILMLAGTKLEPSRPLSAYKLPLEDVAAAADEPVYLYCKSQLKPGAALPQLDVLPAIVPQVPLPLASTAVAAAVAAHPLAKAPQAAVQDLPRHELAFSHHVATASAYWDASSARLQRCRQLLSEQEVQSRAADAATVNVEAHYRWITAAMTSFMQRYQQECAQHAQLLTSFSEDQALLDSIGLPPALQVGQVRTLADLPAASRAREVAAGCRKYLAQFADKVSQLDSLYDSLKLDMEALIMQAPSVDLDSLGVQLVAAEDWQQEQAAIMQVLSKDLATLQHLIEQLVRRSAGAGGLTVTTATRQSEQQPGTPVGQLTTEAVRPAGTVGEEPASATMASAFEGAAGTAAAARGSATNQSVAQLLDACHAVPAMASAHETQQLPRMSALDAGMAVLEEKCISAKQQMTTDVLTMLQRISLQQSKIRDMRARLSGFDALLQRQNQLFAELRPLGRLSAAYRAMLAECERRRAWHQLKTGQAAEFVEQLVAQYQKEASKRQAFLQQVGRYLPQDMLSAAGLIESEDPLPLPTVSVPPAAHNLLPVSLQQLMQVPQPPASVILTMAAISQLLQPKTAVGTPETAAGEAGAEQPAAGLGAAGEDTEGGQAPTYASTLPDPTSMHRLEMENARLRAELADMVAQNSLAQLHQVATQQLPAGMLVSMEGGSHTSAHAASGLTPQVPGSSHPPLHAHSSSDGAGLTARSVGAGAETLAGTTTPRYSQVGQQGPSSGGGSAGNTHAGSQQPTMGPSPTSASPALGRSSSGSNWRRQPSGGLSTVSTGMVSGSPGTHIMHSARSFGHGFNLMAQPSAGSSPTARPPLSTPVGSFGGSASLVSRSPQVSGTGTGAGTAGLAVNSRNSSASHLPAALSLPAQLLLQAQPGPGSSTALPVPDTPGRAAQGTSLTASRMLQAQPGASSSSLQQSGRTTSAASNILAAPATVAAEPATAESQAVAALKQAVAMREQYCTALQFELKAVHEQLSKYADRIQQLEHVLAGSSEQQNSGQSDVLKPGRLDMSSSQDRGARGHIYGGSLQPHAESTVVLHDEPAGQNSAAQSQQASKLHQADSEDPLMCSDSSLFEPHGPISPGAPSATCAQLPAEQAQVTAARQMFQLDPARRATTAPASPQASHMAAGDTATPAARVGSDSAATPAGQQRPASHGGWASPSQLQLNSLSKGHNTLGPIALAALGGSRTHTPEPSIDSAGAQGAGLIQHHAAALSAVQTAQQVAAAGPLPLLLRDASGLGQAAAAGQQAAEPWHFGPFEAMPDVWGTHPLFKGRWGADAVGAGEGAVTGTLPTLSNTSASLMQGGKQQGSETAVPTAVPAILTAGLEAQEGVSRQGGSIVSAAGQPANAGDPSKALLPQAGASVDELIAGASTRQDEGLVSVESSQGMGDRAAVPAGAALPVQEQPFNAALSSQQTAQEEPVAPLQLTRDPEQRADAPPVHDTDGGSHAGEAVDNRGGDGHELSLAKVRDNEGQVHSAAVDGDGKQHTGPSEGSREDEGKEGAVQHEGQVGSLHHEVHLGSVQDEGLVGTIGDGRNEEEEDEPVPDIDEVCAPTTAPAATSHMHASSLHNSTFGSEVRTWPAAGSGLGASMLFGGEEQPQLAPQSGVPPGAVDEGAVQQQQGSVHGSGEEGSSSDLQASMYASAMAADN